MEDELKGMIWSRIWGSYKTPNKKIKIENVGT